MLASYPLASRPIAWTDPPPAELVTPAEIRLSDRGWISRPTDTPANTNFLPRAIVPFVFEQTLPLAPSADRRAAAGYGEIVLANADGKFDDTVARYALDGRRICVKVGKPADAYADFSTLFEGTGAGWRLADDETVRISLRDASYKLDVPLQSNVYLGTGGIEGTAENAGKPKPLSYGEQRNVTPVLIDPVLWIFQVHDGWMQDITEIRDSGAVIPKSGDVADILTASPASGTAMTQLSGGYFRLGSKPAGQVTCDVRGDKTGGVYVNAVADISVRMMRRAAQITDSEIDWSSLDRLRNVESAPIGLYVSDERPMVGGALDRLVAGVAGWWGASRLGKIQLGRIEWPPPDPLVTLTPSEIVNLQWLDLPAPLSPPPSTWRVEYARNWTVQTSGLVLSLPAGQAQFFASTVRVASAFDGTIGIKHLLSSEPPPVPGLYVNKVDAEALAAKLLVLWGIDPQTKNGRRLYLVETKLSGLLLERQQSVGIVDHRLDGGRATVGLVVGHRIDADRNMCALTVLL